VIKFIKISAVLSILSIGVQAQVDVNKLKQPTPKQAVLIDSTLNNFVDRSSDSIKIKPFKPDVVRVVWMGAIVPGYGQILNKKYWKLPIVYGGFLGCAYAISWNASRYNTFKSAYKDIVDNDPNTSSFISILPKGYTVEKYGGISGYTNILKTGQDNFRRYRDLSIIATIGYYALTVVDAFVDAQLYDFDISPDLSMRLQPTIIKNDIGFSKTLAIQCSFNLK
jgi:hypothetical protein